jgi:hypothetical protein
MIGFVSIVLGAKAQKSYDYGVFLGATQNHLYSIMPVNLPVILPVADPNRLGLAVGGYYRKSLNERYSWRAGANFGFDRKNSPKPNMYEGFGLFEFNFHPLSAKREKKLITSYIDVGLSYIVDRPLWDSIMQSATAKKGNYLFGNIWIPFNVGVRYNVSPNLTIGVEWALRKGYQLDYSTPDEPVRNFMLSNWRSHVGITIGYMVSNYCRTCPFYENEREKLK